MTISLQLPFPPTTNNLFAGTVRRYPSTAYKAWREEAESWLVLQRHQFAGYVSGPYAITICLDRPDRRGRDLANYEKAVSDFLVTHKVIEDDSLSRRLVMEWTGDEPVKEARAWITIDAA